MTTVSFPMLPTPRRLLTTPSRGPRQLSVAAVIAVVLCLGGAVAVVYGTGVVLGSRIAPAPDLPPDRAATGVGTPAGDPSTPTRDTAAGPTVRSPGSSLPDRVERRSSARTSAPPATGAEREGGSGGTRPEGGLDAALGPYLAVWPYATWSEVRGHVARRDPSFTTPEDTARRFAEEVVGVPDARLGTQRVAGGDALIEVRTPTGTTTVVLARPDLGDGVDPPWGVVSASGDLAVTAGPAGPGRVDAEVRGPGPSVVGVDDRIGWRGVARTVDGSASVRVETGPAVPAAVVAVGGDPRDPASFAVARVDIGPGAPLPTPPTAARVAAADVAAGLAAGDVSGVWSGLDAAARRTVLDWRGLVARWDELEAQLAPLGGEAATVTRVDGPGVPVDVVSAPAPDGGAVASVFRPGRRGSLLVSVTTPSVRWDLSSGAAPTLTVRGPTRPSALVVNGRVRAAEGAGGDGLSVDLSDVEAGSHLAVAVFLDGDVSAAATIVTTAEVDVTDPGPPDPPAPAPTPPTTTRPARPAPEPGRPPPPGPTTATTPS